jgi:hypothetical protein
MSGAIRHLALDPVNENRLYAAAENGGLWVMDDVRLPGAGWRPLSDRLDNLQMRGMAKSAKSADYLVVANATGHLHHSFDHGQSWQRAGDQNFRYVRRVTLHERMQPMPAAPGLPPTAPRMALERRIWVAGQTGLFVQRWRGRELIETRQLFPAQGAEPEQAPDVLDALVEPESGVLCVGARDQGVWKFSPTSPASSTSAISTTN